MNREETIASLKLLASKTEVLEVKAVLLSLAGSLLVGSERHFAKIIWDFTEDELANIERTEISEKRICKFCGMDLPMHKDDCSWYPSQWVDPANGKSRPKTQFSESK